MSSDLIAKISEYSDSKTKRAFSQVERRIQGIVLKTVKTIRVFPPNGSSAVHRPLNEPEDILIRVLRRYPCVRSIIFGPPKHLGRYDAFGSNEIPYLNSMITQLESDPQKHSLSSVTRFEYYEIIRDFFGEFDPAKAKELNKRFLKVIGHKGLEDVRIKVHHNGSILTGDEIQPILDNSESLKSFQLDGDQSQSITLSFVNKRELVKVKLLYWNGSASTIQSLVLCENLEELIIHSKAYTRDEIKAVLQGDTLWKLKRLELKEVPVENDAELDAITKRFPNLECLLLELRNISDEGMELLGRNCSSLKTLKMSNENLTNSGLNRLTQHLPQLEVISFDEAYNITGNGIAALAQNCRHLRLIQVVHYKKVKKWGIDALAENCPNLKVIEFSYGGRFCLEGMLQLADRMPNLRYVTLKDLRGITDEQIEKFYERFPHIMQIPYTSSLKKLHSLVRRVGTNPP